MPPFSLMSVKRAKLGVPNLDKIQQKQGSEEWLMKVQFSGNVTELLSKEASREHTCAWVSFLCLLLDVNLWLGKFLWQSLSWVMKSNFRLKENSNWNFKNVSFLFSGRVQRSRGTFFLKKSCLPFSIFNSFLVDQEWSWWPIRQASETNNKWRSFWACTLSPLITVIFLWYILQRL